MKKKKKIKPAKPKRMKTTISVIGIILTIIGWAITNTENLSLIKKVVAPKYDTAMATWKNMTKKGFVLRAGDKGFSEIKDLVNLSVQTLVVGDGEQMREEWRQIKQLDSWDITQFKTLDSRTSIVEAKLQPVKAITLEIQSSNFHTITIPSLFSVEEAIEFYYLKTPIFKAGAFIFWLGIILSVFSIFYPLQRTEKNQGRFK